MDLLLYIHGFLSSPSSEKALQVAQWLAHNCPDIHFECPRLSAYPGESVTVLEELVQRDDIKQVGIVGSSLGGYYATYLAERFGARAVLVNPAVAPYRFMQAYLHQDLKNYHTADSYRLNEAHIDEIKGFDVTTINSPHNLWLMAQTGDETLDYRDAVEKYQGCHQTIEEGGDHSFQNFSAHIPKIVQFLFEQDK